ncbi:MAG: toll/interleukin-1 receptor domain-containing protein [Acidobacteriota bacterium]|nr:toll/interleukin-1 receptor domain-containing protein [Acidobacteriota bacterium]
MLPPTQDQLRIEAFHRRPGDVVDVGEPLMDLKVRKERVTLLSSLGGRIYWFYPDYIGQLVEGGGPAAEIGTTGGVYKTHKIFLGYRQDDVPHLVGRVFERLVADFGRSQVFMDIYSLTPGDKYPEQIATAISKADLFVLMIGAGWLGAVDRRGNRKLDLSTDQHRVELELSLGRTLPILPVLVDGAGMPSADDLPDPLKALSVVQALRLSAHGWNHEIVALRDAVGRRLPWRESGSKPKRG